MRAFQEMHPAHEHFLWTDADLEEFVQRDYPQLYLFYMGLPVPILRADLARYLLLNTFGGIYTDADTESLKPFNQWPANEEDLSYSEFIVGIEVDTVRADWADWYARSLQLCQWTMASVPRHPILSWVIHESTLVLARLLRDNPGNEKELFRIQMNILDSTGPGLWTDIILNYLDPYLDSTRDATFRNLLTPILIHNVTILPLTGFSPGMNTMGSGNFDDLQAKVRHHFNGGWKKGPHKG